MKPNVWTAIAGLLTALASFSVLTAGPAMARVDQEQAFTLCIAQPDLQSASLGPNIDYQLSIPHDPALDGMSKAQITNAIQYNEGNLCAAELVAHPDVFSMLVAQQSAPSDDRENAWSAFNRDCRHNLTGVCIATEVKAAAAIRAVDPPGDRLTPSRQACLLVLPSDVDWVQQKKCMDAVGNQHPTHGVIIGCGASLQRRSGKDGTAIGRKIGRCFKTCIEAGAADERLIELQLTFSSTPIVPTPCVAVAPEGGRNPPAKK